MLLLNFPSLLRPPHRNWTRLLQILSLFQSLVLSPERGQKEVDPTKSLPRYFLPPPNIRQGKEALEVETKPTQFPRVSLDGLGDVEGYFLKVISGRYVYAFEGIGYAQPPVGNLRFRAPVPKEPWISRGVLHAKKWPPICTQTRATRPPGLHGQEDCLYINVYSPKLPSGKNNTSTLLPVIIFLHGGAYAVGSSNEYGPSYLMVQDICLVTLNYRLGVFGFLSMGNSAVSGNWGLKDQSLAISWVKDHISKFGCDPTKITLMGQSAGAVASHFHLMSPMSKDKISAVIALSGNGFMTWALRRPTEERKLARRLAALNLCPSHPGISDAFVMECLRSRSTTNITLAATVLQVGERKVFMPVIEPEGAEGGAFITKSTSQYYAEGAVAPVPFITTMTSRELEFTLAVKAASFDTVPEFRFLAPPIAVAFSPALLDYHNKVHNEAATTKAIFKFYGGERKIRTDSTVIAQIASDRHFAMGLRSSIRHHMKIAPTYTYFFNYTNNLGFANDLRLNPDEFGVPHGEDILFLFNRTQRKAIERTQGHFAVVKLLQNLFTNFATTGEPLYTDENFNDVIIWERVKSEHPVHFLLIDKEVKMTSIPKFQAASDFWDSLGIRDL